MRLRSFLIGLLCISLLLIPVFTVASAQSEGVLDKIERTGKIVIGHREGSVPFGFYDEAGNWVGFSIDIAKLLVEELEKKLDMDVKYIKKPVNPKTRIPLVANRTVDIVMGSSTHTIPRDEVVDFTISFFLTGTRLLVEKGGPIQDFEDLAGKKVGAARGSTNERALRKANEKGTISPPAKIVEFEEHTKGFLALRQGKLVAYCTDASLLAGLKQKAPNPDNWIVTGRLLTYDPYAYIVPENDSEWRDFVNTFLIHLIKSGKFYEIYDKWMGPEGTVPIAMSDEYKTLLKLQSWPE